MLIWHACELHTHSQHSDGDFTVEELCQRSLEAGYDTVALTDHNTVSGYEELLRSAPRYGLHAIRGNEWSSYYGHMVTHGARYYIPWQEFGVEEIHKGIALVHQAGGICGIAHPFTIGEPFCLGCHWHFAIHDWNHPDYIEVWNDWHPSMELSNRKAFDWWTEKLNEGYRIYAASGRDWHNDDRPHHTLPVTYVGIEDDRLDQYEQGWLEGMKKGRIVVSFGPLMRMELLDETTGRRYIVGDNMDRRSAGEQLQAEVSLDFDRRKRVGCPDPTGMELRIVSNAGVLYQQAVVDTRRQGEMVFAAQIPASGLKWVRCELMGAIDGRYQMLAFTNPTFVV